ncbi:hypothetical protein Droror1_Dr00012840 [Drosera rotundifolia]
MRTRLMRRKMLVDEEDIVVEEKDEDYDPNQEAELADGDESDGDDWGYVDSDNEVKRKMTRETSADQGQTSADQFMSSNSPPNLTSSTPTTPTADQGQISADQDQTSVDHLLPSADHVSTIEFSLDEPTPPHLSMNPPTPSKRTKMAYRGPNKMAYRRTKM